MSKKTKKLPIGTIRGSLVLTKYIKDMPVFAPINKESQKLMGNYDADKFADKINKYIIDMNRFETIYKRGGANGKSSKV